MTDYVALNRASWDQRAPVHAASSTYAVDRFAEDPTFISDVVRFDLPRLGDVAGSRGAHLQCHIGTDTVSLARLGADMTGLDFSPASVAEVPVPTRYFPAASSASFIDSSIYGLSILWLLFRLLLHRSGIVKSRQFQSLRRRYSSVQHA